MPEPEWGRSNHWLSVIQINPVLFGANPEEVRLHLEKSNIESRPVWKPMHLQPIFAKYPSFNRHVSEELFEKGLCLPSGSSLTESDLDRIISAIIQIHKATKA